MIRAEYVEQATVTNWPLRIALVAVVIAVIALVLWGMWRGWQGRLRRQGDLPLPAVEGVGPWVVEVPGLMVGSSRAGDWLDRIVIGDLGVPSRGVLRCGPAGVWLDRIGARSVFIPVADLVAVRADRGVAGMVKEKGGVIVVTWRLGEAEIETGIRADDPTEQRTLLDGVMALVEQQ